MTPEDRKAPGFAVPRRWAGIALLLIAQAIFVIPSWLARLVRSVVERDSLP